MAKTRATVLLILFFALEPRIMAQNGQSATLPELHIAIAPDKDERGQLTIDHHKHFNVHLTNRSDKPIRLWDQSCQPGHATMSFRITDKDGKSWTMRKARLDGDWDDYPLKMISIAAGATYAWRVTPMQIQSTWSWTGTLEPNSGEDITIVPTFEIKADAQAKEQGIWTGRVEGKAIKVRVVNPNLITPHDYLWNQCPKQALKIMQADPKWINKKDPKDSCMPLHHASRFAFVEVVDWLLANGADVDARAYNDFSPLYFADDPQVVRAILRHKPKDKERAVIFFRQPLEHAAQQVAWSGADVKKWREIVNLMLDAGAPYSLQAAAYLNDVAHVREALKENPRLANSLEPSKRALFGPVATPLRVAARHARTEICKILLEHKADPNDWANGCGFPVLVDAIQHPSVVKLLLDSGANVKERISWRSFKSGRWLIDDEATALHFASQHGALESAKLLLDAGVDVNAKDTRGHTALDIAVQCGQGDVAHLIATRMATPDARDKGWKALLRQLVFSGKSDRLKQVLQDKGVAEILTREGPAFMKSAASQVSVGASKRLQQDNARHLAIIESLHDHGIHIDMYSAITSDKLARVKELLQAKPALAKSKEGTEPFLHRATTLDRQEIAELLLKAGADPDDRDDGGYSALHSAAFWQRPEIAKLLIKRRADVNARAKNGLSPLHEAVRLGSVEVARLLIAAGANVNITDNEGRTPLQLARVSEEAELIKLLLEHTNKR